MCVVACNFRMNCLGCCNGFESPAKLNGKYGYYESFPLYKNIAIYVSISIQKLSKQFLNVYMEYFREPAGCRKLCKNAKQIRGRKIVLILTEFFRSVLNRFSLELRFPFP